MSGLKITGAHLRRLAVVYVRQSTLAQVDRNRESTARQYDLVNRAAALGWPRSAVRVIDEDLGLSGSSVTGRAGFAELAAQVGLGQVGIVLSLECSRLARNNADWYRLLDLAGMTDTLIADTDGVYHPALFNDRLVLGMKGTMSEALCRRRHNASRGYSADRTMIAAWTCGSRGPATTTRGRPGSSNPGSRPTPTAWTTWSGCAGRTASCALAATTPVGGWAVGDGRYKCAGCGARTSVTAGTLFDRRRTPLTVWFTACWMFASQKDGVSALSLQRTLEIGSYATAWAMLHRLRSVLV